MQGYENTLMSKYMTDNLVKECQIVAATRLIDKSGKKYSDYGLDKPSVEVKVIYSDNSKVNMYFGNEAPDKSGIYCRIDGNKNVYLVNSASVDMFFIDKLQLFDKTLTGELSDSENITLVEISGKGYEKPVIISREKNGFAKTWNIWYDKGLTGSSDLIETPTSTGVRLFTYIRINILG